MIDDLYEYGLWGALVLKDHVQNVSPWYEKYTRECSNRLRPGPLQKILWQNRATVLDWLPDRTLPATELVGSPDAEP